MTDQEFKVSNEDKAEIEAALEEYERQATGLPKWEKMDAPEYLAMSLETLRKKTPEELSEAVFQMTQYSLNVQRTINRNRAWERWAKGKIEQVAVANLEKIPAQYDRMTIARNGPEICRRLQNFLLTVSMRVDRLYDVPKHIDKLAETIKDMKFLAMKREKEFANAE